MAAGKRGEVYQPSGRGSASWGGARMWHTLRPVSEKWNVVRMHLASAPSRFCARAHARSCHLPAFRMRAGRVTSSRLIRKRRRRQRRENRGAVVGGCSRDPNEKLVTRKRKRVPGPASVSGPYWASGPGAAHGRLSKRTPSPRRLDPRSFLGPWPHHRRALRRLAVGAQDP